MQEPTFERYEEPAEVAPSRFARVRGIVSTAIGAVVALSLLLALGVWFYRLGVRDAQNVPIIRASTDPAKVRPEDPGGTTAPHQDVKSYEIAESGQPSAVAALVAPEPAKPSREDVAMAELQAAAPAETEVDQLVGQVIGESEQEAQTEDTSASLTSQPSAQQPIPQQPAEAPAVSEQPTSQPAVSKPVVEVPTQPVTEPEEDVSVATLDSVDTQTDSNAPQSVEPATPADDVQEQEQPEIIGGSDF
ncbi:MAG: hypothetical protein AAF557_27635, partial [Pseudomonadota bacterium]